MPDGSEPPTVKVIGSIADIPSGQWDACAGDGDPFVGHDFLSALEESGSVAAEAGWQPQHLVVEDENGLAVACAPLYLKSHSYGEYVFDWGWVEAYQRAGGRYYPKLQSAVPFTPVTGPRLLVRPGSPREMEDVLIAAMVQLAGRLGVSSLHVTFPSEDQWRRFGAAGFLLRTGHQFHWENRGYKDFDDFLRSLTSRKRKAIVKERRAAADQGAAVSILTGNAIEERHWDAFHRFYQDTSDGKWGPTYLNRRFFSLLGERMADKVVLVMAEDQGRFVGGALNLLGGEALYGRYWGGVKDYRFLHFEACYYRAIDFAIAHRLKRVEAGAQGPHKVQRGYLPRLTYSAHWIADENFREAVSRYLESERRDVDMEIRELARHSPFRRDGGR